MTADHGKLAEIATAQRGLFTRRQARDCGFSDYQVRRRLRDRQWQVFLGPVFAGPGQPRTPGLLDRAAWLAVPGSVLAGPSAARLHGIPVPDRRPWLAVPSSAHPRVAGVRLVRGRLSEYDLVVLDGIPVTDQARTVFDCLRAFPEAAARDLLDRALQQQWIRLDDLCGRVHASVGRRGIRQLVRLTAGAASGARSAAERRAVALLRGARLRGWVANAPVHDPGGELIGVVDVLFATERRGGAGRTRLPRDAGAVRARSAAPERPDGQRLDGAALHLARPDGAAGLRHRHDSTCRGRSGEGRQGMMAAWAHL